MPVTGVVVPKGVTVVTAEQGGTQVPASGGSIINFSDTTVYVVALQEDIGLTDNAAPLAPGAALPWPTNVTCYAWVDSGQASVYVTPVNSSVYPVPGIVTISNTPLPVEQTPSDGEVGTFPFDLPDDYVIDSFWGHYNNNTSVDCVVGLTINGVIRAVTELNYTNAQRAFTLTDLNLLVPATQVVNIAYPAGSNAGSSAFGVNGHTP